MLFEFLKINKNKNLKWHENIYIYLIYISFLLYFIALTGALSINPLYLEYLKNITSLYIAIILILRFNPFRKFHKITRFDKDIVFSSAILLLVSSSITIALKSYIKKEIVTL